MFENCYRDFQPHKALDQDKNALARQIDNPQVRITGALHAILCRPGKITVQSRCRAQQLANHVLKVAA
jgi:hypothetical protein